MRYGSERQRAAARERRAAVVALEKSLTAEKLAETLAAAGAIHTVGGAALSPKNTALVYLQMTAAGVIPSLVGGFRQWREHGRQVRKGYKGAMILYPRIGKNDETGADELRGFSPAYVWDILQTCRKGEEQGEREQEQEQEERAAVAPVAAPDPVAPVAAAAPAGGGGLDDIFAAIDAAGAAAGAVA